MKKIILLALLSLPFVSCTKETIIEKGDTIIQYSKETYEIIAKPNHWVEVGNFGEPGYHFEAPYIANYITNDVLYYDVVLAYAQYNEGDYMLPDIFADEINGSKFVKILTYKLEKGKIIFSIESSDFKVEKFTKDITFKIVVIK